MYTRPVRTYSFITLTIAILGCGDDDTPITDAAPDVADTGPLVAPPAPPNFSPCPSGWTESVGGQGQTTCEPWASPPPSTCGDDEGIFPGEEGCVRVGSACPAGEFADDLPTGPRIYYVSAAAPTGGDGSLAAPFTRVSLRRLHRRGRRGHVRWSPPSERWGDSLGRLHGSDHPHEHDVARGAGWRGRAARRRHCAS